ncbi:MAG: BCCT family transporter [Vicinamibacterales bacterium]|jgi:BCCT family betaine/carnitine transporter|nr:BCCT family transporter [Vicinamibacterales bacterium]HJN43873.1 BCCT family transporter [Vicinamibacterales bacterium]
MEQREVDWPSFGGCLAIIVVVCVPLAAFPEAGGRLLQRAYDLIAGTFGFAYLLAGVGVMALLAWLAFGRHGPVVLGADDAAPDFSTYSWVAMLFCAGIGAGMLAWAPIEWAYYYDAPPFGAAPRSVEAAAWGSTYGIFHWGPTAWGFYCLPTVAIAYPYYTQRLTYLRFSTSCQYFFGGREETRRARVIDWLFMIALLGGAGSSLGFSTPLIAACISRLTGVERDFGLEVVVVGLCVALFGTSVWFGLKKGIKRLSDVNVVLALVLLAYMVIVGPTVFLLQTSLNSVGVLLAEFIRMNSWTDPFTDSGFVERWTIFYWAWWVAYGPFVGLFVTRISRGRTLRQVILGMIGWGSLGSALFFMVMGNYGLHLELTGVLGVSGLLDAEGAPTAIVAMLDQLPAPGLVVGVFCLVCVVFAATTYDSASYTLAAAVTRRLAAGDDPPRWHRLFWAVALTLLPLTLMFVGGLEVMQTATLVASLPILVVGVFMSIALVKQLARDHPGS